MYNGTDTLCGPTISLAVTSRSVRKLVATCTILDYPPQGRNETYSLIQWGAGHWETEAENSCNGGRMLGELRQLVIKRPQGTQIYISVIQSRSDGNNPGTWTWTGAVKMDWKWWLDPRDIEKEEARGPRGCLEKSQATAWQGPLRGRDGCQEEMKTWRKDPRLVFRHHGHSGDSVSRQSEIHRWHSSKKSQLKLYGVVFWIKAQVS